MLKVMTKREAEESDATLDAWWAGLDWAIKEKVRSLIFQAQLPSTAHLPMQYAEDLMRDAETITVAGRPEGFDTRIVSAKPGDPWPYSGA